MHMVRPDTQLWRQRLLLAGALLTCGVFLFVGVLTAESFFPHWQLEYEVLHAVIETLGCMLAIGLAGFLLMRHSEDDSGYMLWLACSVLAMGILDAFHASVVPSSEFVGLRCTAQLTGGVFIALIWLPGRFAHTRAAKAIPKALVIAAGLFGTASLLFPEILPTMVSDGRFTFIAQMLNFTGGVLFLLGFAYFICRFDPNEKSSYLLFATYCLLCAIAGLAFSFIQLWTGGWWLLKLMRLGAYAAAFGHVSTNSTLEYLRLTRSEKSLKQAKELTEKSRNELARLNKQLEASVKQANVMTCEAQAASEIKSQFLANMSHEIRTPMNAIIGFTEVLAEEDLTDEQKEFVAIVMDAGQTLLTLINDILDFSKIEAGKLDIEIVHCSLEKLLTTVESLMRPLAAKKGLELEVTRSGELPLQIRTDPGRVHQCLINLVGNAIKFTEQGYVHINVSLQETDNEPHLHLSVEDTGIGIPPDRQEVIFEAFRQADNRTTRKFHGTGLGLTITKQLARLLGGDLAVTSEVGKGSVFLLKIPVGVDRAERLFSHSDNRGEGLSAEQDQVNQIDLSGHILVAEDCQTNQALMKLLLERMGFEVTIAQDGNDAVQKALAQQFDLILMDMQMPDMNGYEAATKLRKEGYETPIIALTANAMRGDKKKCIDAGCNDYLSKPIDRNKLLKIIHKYLPPANRRIRATTFSHIRGTL